MAIFIWIKKLRRIKDIQNFSDVSNLVDSFYTKVSDDHLLGPIFNERAQINWEHHLPKMKDFWANILLHSRNYKGRPFEAHLKLGQLTTEQFLRWLSLFYETVDEHFVGNSAEKAKLSAQNIATVLQMKLKVIPSNEIPVVE